MIARLQRNKKRVVDLNTILSCKYGGDLIYSMLDEARSPSASKLRRISACTTMIHPLKLTRLSTKCDARQIYPGRGETRKILTHSRLLFFSLPDAKSITIEGEQGRRVKEKGRLFFLSHSRMNEKESSFSCMYAPSGSS